MMPKPFTKEKYAPNHEITCAFDKSLSAKCENGTFVGYLEDDVLAFKGIPFAKAPVGKLRWRLPEPPEASDKVFEAFHSGKISIQPQAALDADLTYEMGEDCLTLNIYTNITDKSEKKAVMVWVHGGAWLSGGNSSPNYDGYNLIANHPDVILVSINYRLGICGFVDFSHIEGGEDYPNVNLGIHDQVAALKWVKKNIAAFGGDPDRITIFGESAGAGSVSTLAVLPEARGLFKRVISQSGPVSLCTTNETATLPIDNLAKAFGAKSMDDLLAIPEDKLIEYWHENSATSANGYNFIVLDGHIFDGRDPFDLWEEGATKDLDILQGYMADEWMLFSSVFKPKEVFCAFNQDMADRLLEYGNEEYKRAYEEYREYIKNVEDPEWRGVDFVSNNYFGSGIRRQTKAHAKNGGRGYTYIFDVTSANPALKACHIVDVYYVFGNFNGVFAKDTPENRKLSRKIQKMWTNFAKTGNPSTDDLNWTPYDTDKHPTAIIRLDDLHMENDPWRVRRELFERMVASNPRFSHSWSLSDMAAYVQAKHSKQKN